MRILVTGATGYVGGRLAPRLLDEGHQVRCMTRRAARLRDVSWAAAADVVEADALDPPAVEKALAGVDAAYYLIHSIDSGRDFTATDRRAATIFAQAARQAGVRRLVYLGGLGPAEEHGESSERLTSEHLTSEHLTSEHLTSEHLTSEHLTSEHLTSRREVGTALLESGVPTAVLQAAVVVGSGSASFEMLRYLTERLPVMVTPRWVRTRVQPIAIRDVLRYLVGCLDLPSDVSRRFDIGGPDVLTYAEMMRRFAAVEGLRRRVVLAVPVLSPNLSSYWVGLVTPVPAAIARPLVRSLSVEVVCSERDIAQFVPDPPEGLLSFEDSVAYALRRVRDRDVATRWSAAAPDAGASLSQVTDPAWAGGSLFVDERSATVDATRQALWRVVEGIGGENGWYSWPLAWSARGWLDVAVGGVGLRRGRRDPARLYVGEALDFWRVEDLVPGELLLLRAEMKLPGQAWLELRVGCDDEGRTRYRQRALFHPRGLAGQVYWWAVSPFHAIVFGGMLRNIVRRAEAEPGPKTSPSPRA